MKKSEELRKKLSYERKLFWDVASSKEQEAAFKFSEGYKTFLDFCKTEREATFFVENIAKEHGFKEILKNGSDRKIYKTAHGKNIIMAVIGKKPVSEGVNIIASHIDSPRVDLKQNPLYEDKETKLGMMKTHYYGGIKKYQWLSTPLALHGTIIKANGETVNVVIGEDENEPVFVIPDLLPHLARKEQYSKKLGEAIPGEKMHLVFSSIPYFNDEEKSVKDGVKLNVLLMLNEKYGITEADFLSAEIELVPAGKARDVGLDKSMIMAYGQDDRICAYTSVMATLDTMNLDFDKKIIVYLADKEEIGSEGNTGSKSIFLYDFVGDLLKHNGEDFDSYTLRKTIMKSQILSSDVNAAINPNFPSVHEAQNAVHMGFGVSITKFTGSGGKSSSNDANAEFMAKISRVLNEAGVNWQIGTLGKVDEGGGGTIAKYLAERGAEVIDCGTGLLGMHSLYELCSKADLYSTYQAYKAFITKA